MLASLHIKNVALIEDNEISFGANLNVISGETGAGKSIMLDALKFVLGDRLDKTKVREGADFMKVDAIFSNLSERVSKDIELISGVEIIDGEIKLSREYSLSGKTSIRLNGELITGSTLKKITAQLVDIHGQHEHQAVLNKDFQLEILDQYSKNELNDNLIQLNDLIDKINEIDLKLKLLGGDAQEKQNLCDLYRYQLNEIESASIGENELEELETTLKEMKGSEKISQNLNEINSLLDKNSFGASAQEQICQAEKLFMQLACFGEKYEILSNRLNSVCLELNDVISTSFEILSNCQFDEKEFNKLDERVDFIKTLYRKYGGDYLSLKKYYDDISNKLNILESGEEEYRELTKKKESLIFEISELQEKITSIRKRYAGELQEKIQVEIRKLGMPNAQFSIDFSKRVERFTRKGQDEIEFMFTANLGFEKRPLAKIASGGELSRFMLAYKIVVNDLDDIDCLIFDEIDTGISGNTAIVVSQCMGRLSRGKQLIVITHLPQICAMGDDNYLVEKFSNPITKSKVSLIKEEALNNEIARLMGLVGEKGREFAKELKTDCENFKSSINNI